MVEAGSLDEQVIEEPRAGNPSNWVREPPDGSAFIVRTPTLIDDRQQIIARCLKGTLA